MTSTFVLAFISGTVAIISAVAFFLVFLTIAYVVFRMLRKTVKMAIRLMVVGVILAVAVAGSIALWALGPGKLFFSPSRPTRTR